MTESEDIDIVKKRLGQRSIVLVGLMGCGKSSVGKRLAFKLGLPFVDADDEIERAAAKSINEIFADHGEAQFRDGERKVIARLLRNGPQVLATGGGAYMHAETRQCVRENGISIWLRAELAGPDAPGDETRHAAAAARRQSRSHDAETHRDTLSGLC